MISIMIVITYDIKECDPCHDLDHKRIVGMIKSLHIYIMYVTNITTTYKPFTNIVSFILSIVSTSRGLSLVVSWHNVETLSILPRYIETTICLKARAALLPFTHFSLLVINDVEFWPVILFY